MTTDSFAFPRGFRWGVSTSAHQVEGGFVPSQWCAWEDAGHVKPGRGTARVRPGDERGKACDWWANAERDFDLAQGLGLNALRLSVDWSRLEPRQGRWDDAAFERYRQMLRGLRARGLAPMVCLHHFTHPLWMEVAGGFLAPESVRWFERLARKVTEELGGECDEWVTFNEPNVHAVQGYLLGEFPPGHRGRVGAAMRVLGNMARAHAAAYYAVHAVQPAARVGFTQNYLVFEPADPRSPLDRLAARIPDTLFNDAFPRIVETGYAPTAVAKLTGRLREVAGTFDFVAFNLYGRTRVAFDLRRPGELFLRRSVPEDAPRGDTSADSPFGETFPGGISLVAARLARMGRPIYVLENGVPDAGDRIRPWLIAGAVRELHAAIARGIDVRGYYHWTLVDNFEWAEGWSLRFGLFALDPATQERTARGSARLYGAIARANALGREMVAEHAPAALGELFPEGA
jgi:beta-glucosidase